MVEFEGLAAKKGASYKIEKIVKRIDCKLAMRLLSSSLCSLAARIDLQSILWPGLG